MRADEDRRITDAFQAERSRLRAFILKHAPDRFEVEDILQDVFFELVTAYRLAKPIDRVGAWLFRVARNRITDRLRKRRPERLGARPEADAGEDRELEELLPSPDAGPEAAYARRVLIEELADALDELPAEQRTVFLAHAVEGRSFKELAAATGAGINTLLSRKHYAVLHLRRRLQAIHDDFKKGGMR
jgi:RNA polymerase sigma factor (sigma-70 family)